MDSILTLIVGIITSLISGVIASILTATYKENKEEIRQENSLNISARSGNEDKALKEIERKTQKYRKAEIRKYKAMQARFEFQSKHPRVVSAIEWFTLLSFVMFVIALIASGLSEDPGGQAPQWYSILMTICVPGILIGIFLGLFHDNIFYVKEFWQPIDRFLNKFNRKNDN